MELHTLINYEVLRVIWWLLLGVLLIGFAITDGFDLGTAALLPFIGKNDVERRIVINTVGPVWEGNQVWLITGGGAIFAAWPILYAVSFSGFYLAMFATLFALILRPVGFKYRSKLHDATWRKTWDWCLFIGGAVPALIFGVALGNVLQGVPFHFNPEQRIYYDGTTLFELLNPFGILAGLVSVAMLVTHGATWVAVKTQGAVESRARTIGSITGIATAVLYILAGVWLYMGIKGYAYSSPAVLDGPSNPLLKTAVGGVEKQWFANYGALPILWIVPILGIVGALLAAVLLKAGKALLAFICSSLSMTGIISSVGVSMFPMILPSSVNPSHSLTVWDTSSSHMILFIMLVVALIFVPIVLAYTSYVFYVLRGKVTRDSVDDSKTFSY
ncbi:cytochrome d ubiquinol oxidase subunit II [Saezia sanguinis]|uniref:cytochrome d ubiquinol oxidase subunit II n=1 Tax=Saezia sanguinis TaxID=1965230 RepID=UPI0030697271